ncbi:MAG TPA: hypothetical protein VFM25_14440 [Verrucomicrobiae bacterium]|jgi:hypothetical protein|nr:hypothetical protein [Verrucomicrobiae bacterium]
MKTLYLLCAAASLVLMDGCATARHKTKWADKPPATAALPTEKLWVISAVYGSGANFADVTYRVDSLLHQPSTEFYARPQWLHADPTPGWNKALVIVYEFKGRRHLFVTGEGGRVSVEDLIHPRE